MRSFFVFSNWGEFFSFFISHRSLTKAGLRRVIIKVQGVGVRAAIPLFFVFWGLMGGRLFGRRSA